MLNEYVYITSPNQYTTVTYWHTISIFYILKLPSINRQVWLTQNLYAATLTPTRAL